MKLSRSQALVLAKELFRVDSPRHGDALSELKDRIDEFLIGGDEVVDDEVDEESEDCDSDDEEEDTVEEEEEEEDEIIEDGDVKADHLHRLCLQTAKYDVASCPLEEVDELLEHNTALSFETINVDGDSELVERVDLLVDEGECIIEDVDFVKRTGTSLLVHERDVGWHTFNVTKFEKSWVKTLPVSKILAVVE